MKKKLTALVVAMAICTTLWVPQIGSIVGNASEVYSTIISGGAVSPTMNINERTVAENGHITLSPASYYEHCNVYDNTKYIPVTATTRGDYAISMKIYNANAAGQPLFRPTLLGYHTDTKQIISIPYKEWIPFAKDSGKEYQEVLLRFSDFSDTGKGKDQSATYPRDVEIQRDDETDEGFRILPVEWDKVYAGVGATLVKYDHQPSGKGQMHWGNTVVDDVKIIKITEVAAQLQGQNIIGNRTDTVVNSKINIPNNSQIAVVFNSTFNESPINKITLSTVAESVYTPITAEVTKKAGTENTFFVTPTAPLTVNGEYIVKVDAGLVDTAGQTTANPFYMPFIAATATPMLPKITNVAVSGSARDSVSLTWDAVADGVDKYVIYKDDIKYATCNTNAYIDTNCVPSTAYKYNVVGVKGVNVSTLSDNVAVTTAVFGAPSGLRVVYATANEVKFQWDAYNGDVTGYQIYWTPTKGGEPATELALVKGTTYVHNNRAGGKDYAYAVKAVGKNADNVEYYSAKSDKIALVTPKSNSAVKTIFSKENWGSSVSFGGGWGGGYNGLADFVSVNPQYKPFQMGIWAWNGEKTSFTNTVTAAAKADGGIYLSLKSPDPKKLGTIKFVLLMESGGDIEVPCELKDGDFMQIFLNFDAITKLTSGGKIKGLGFYGGSDNVTHEFLIDDVRIANATPKVDLFYYTSLDGTTIEKATNTLPTDISAVNMVFTSNMDVASLANIKLMVDGKDFTDFKGSYSSADMRYTMELTSRLPYGAAVEVVVPTTVKSTDAYMLNAEGTAVDMTAMSYGKTMTAESKDTFTTEANPLSVDLCIANDAGVKVENLTDVDIVKGKVVISHRLSANVGATLILATYTTVDGMLVLDKIQTKAIDTGAIGNAQTVLTDGITIGKGATVKAFLWNDLGNIVPIGDSVMLVKN